MRSRASILPRALCRAAAPPPPPRRTIADLFTKSVDQRPHGGAIGGEFRRTARVDAGLQDGMPISA